MNKAYSTIAICIGLAAVASAQAKLGDVTTSADPAKAASVEQHAAALRAGQTPRAAHTSKHTAKHTHHAALQHPSGQKAPAKG